MHCEIKEKELETLVKTVESADGKLKHREIWRIVSDITGRKTVTS